MLPFTLATSSNPPWIWAMYIIPNISEAVKLYTVDDMPLREDTKRWKRPLFAQFCGHEHAFIAVFFDDAMPSADKIAGRNDLRVQVIISRRLNDTVLRHLHSPRISMYQASHPAPNRHIRPNPRWPKKESRTGLRHRVIQPSDVRTWPVKANWPHAWPCDSSVCVQELSPRGQITWERSAYFSNDKNYCPCLRAPCTVVEFFFRLHIANNKVLPVLKWKRVNEP